MLISEDKILFPDECPDNCIYRGSFMTHGQSSLCFRCPILNCGGEMHVIEPEDYRKDWAAEWKRFFDGTIDYPSLPLKIMSDEETEGQKP